MRFVSLISLVATVGAASLPALENRDYESVRAAYLLVNDPAGNSLTSLRIGLDGKVSSPVKTPTHGKGLVGNSATGPSLADSLFSQDAITVHGNYIFAVNPGSHTLSLFNIPPNDPWHPVLVGSPVDTKGEFPISVAYSEKINTACVLNAGAKASVSCFSVHPKYGLECIDDVPRTIPALHQTTPPLGPLSTGSDILFNPSSSGLFVSIKGNPGTTPPTLGSVYSWPVQGRKVSEKGTVHHLSSLLVAFSANFLGSDDRLLITDPAYGATILSVGPAPKFTLAEKSHIVVKNQSAICWAAYSPRYDTAYLLDTGRTNITFINPETGHIKGVVVVEPSALGALDAAIQRDWLYVRAADGSVVVVDQKHNKEVQKFNPGLAGPGKGVVGFAVWPKEI